MNATFVCTKHELYLDGYPLWKLIPNSDPETFTVSFYNMYCSGAVSECNEEDDWKIEIVE